MRPLRNLICAIAMLHTGAALVGCASLPEPEAAAFAVLATSSEAAFEGAAAAEEKAIRDLVTGDVTAGKKRLVESEGCAKAISDPKATCHLIFDPSGEKKIEFKATAPNMRVLVGRIAQYGNAMEVLAKAEDIAAINKATGEAAGSIKALLNLVPEVGAAAGAAVDFAKWLHGLHLVNERRSDMLKLANAADPAIQAAAAWMGDIAAAYRSNIVAAESDRLRTFSMALAKKKGGALVLTSEKERRALIDAMFESTKRINAIQSIPGDFSALKDGHSALVQALRDPNVDITLALGRLREFVEHLKAIEAALKK